MKRIDNININLSISDMQSAAYRAFRKHGSQREANWIKCLVGIEEVVEGEKTEKILAREFHGNYQGIIQFILACERAYGKQAVLPLEEVEIENQCGYIFKNSTNQLTYIEV